MHCIKRLNPKRSNPKFPIKFKISQVSVRSLPSVAELASGRAAIGGLIATSIVGNLTGTSIVQQFKAEEPIVAALVVATFAATFAAKPTAQQADLEAGPGRAAMVVMALLVAFDLAFIN